MAAVRLLLSAVSLWLFGAGAFAQEAFPSKPVHIFVPFPPGGLAFGHAGNGTSSHLAGELVKYMAKVNMASVPYRGGAPALNDLIGGHIPLSVNNVPEAKAQIDAGAVRPLGVTTAARSLVL